MPYPVLDENFIKLIFWLSFTGLVEFVICVPLATFLIWQLGEYTKTQQTSFRLRESHIADEIEKLRLQLKNQRENGKAPSYVQQHKQEQDNQAS